MPNSEWQINNKTPGPHIHEADFTKEQFYYYKEGVGTMTKAHGYSYIGKIFLSQIKKIF